MNKFISYKDWLNEIFIDYVKSYEDECVYEIIKNPYPNEVPYEIRAMGDYDGNLWVALSDVNWATHKGIFRMIREIDKNVDSPYNYYDRINQGKSIALQRYLNKNILCLGESYDKNEISNISKETWKKLKVKNPQWKFLFHKIPPFEN
jgi:hypothetical protein